MSRLTQFCLVIIICVGSLFLLSTRQRVIERHPHTRRPFRVSDVLFFLPRITSCRQSAFAAKEKSRLKTTWQKFNQYFQTQSTQKYPLNPQSLKMDKRYLSSIRQDKKVDPKSWQMPNTWQKFNQSQAAFIYLRNSGDLFSGSNNVPVLILKPGYQYTGNCRLTVFEDGHIECIDKKRALKLWQQAGFHD